MKPKLEVCVGNIADIKLCEKYQVDRIELNNGLYLGGLTPSLGLLVASKKLTSIPIISMVRPRGGGFIYSEDEVEVMFLDAKYLILHGSDGLAFGFLTPDLKVDIAPTKRMVELCHEYGREAVFHRGFDMVEDPYQAIEDLIACGVDRVLTSGLKATALQGADLLRDLHLKYGEKISILMGSGIQVDTVEALIETTNIKHVHASFKTWFEDSSTQNDSVSYAYSMDGSYEGVDEAALRALLKVIR
jgi:copper homeostasis protein